LHLYLTSKNILTAFHKNKYHYGLNPDLEKVAELFLDIFPSRSPFGESYEMEFAEDANTNAPGRFFISLGFF